MLIMTSSLCIFSWDRVGLITSTEALYSQAALPTKELLERQGKHVIFRAIDPITLGTEEVSFYPFASRDALTNLL